MPQIMIDRLEFDDAAKVTRHSDGRLSAMPRVARTGIQIYKGTEVGKPHLDRVKVYRPEKEVFKRDAFGSLAHKAITDDHPTQMVDASNWKQLAVGHSGADIVRDGQFVRVAMMLTDSAAVQRFNDGKAELSVGYTCDLDWTPGVDPASGEQYDCSQTNIRANHIAQCDKARGGAKLRIGDDGSLIADISSTSPPPTKDGVTKMSKVLMIDGVSCTMDEQTAQIVQRALDSAAAKESKFQADLATALADAAKAKDEFELFKKKKEEEEKTKDAEIVTLKKMAEDAIITPAKLNVLVADRAAVVGKAKIVLGDKAPADLEALDGDAIKKAVVVHKLGDVAKDWDANAINISYTTLTADVKAPAVGDAASVITTQPTAVRDMQAAFMKPAPVNAASTAYDAMVKRKADAYKTAGKSAA